ncbi:MAG TPA: hydrogenase maturation nickel metallochaperone HypA [Actinomycetes bacterium]|nr:hydrogenase maturation nickel metallochaperone HypA [Actinomycetes bacterium]
MHELGLCEGVLEAVERRAAGRRVTRVRVRVGAQHRVVESAFDQSFALVAQGTVADCAAVDLVVVPVRARCGDCGNEAEATDVLAICPACGGLDIEVTAGEELLVDALELEDRFDDVASTRGRSA